MCWLTYTGDNNERLICSRTEGEKAAPCAWGIVDAWKSLYAEQTNNIRNGLLFPYNTALRIHNSIDNGALGIYRQKDCYGYRNVPGLQHSYGCAISFADGHAQYWKWKDP